MTNPPILDLKDTDAPSVFQPANLLREARRQRGLDHAEVPAICRLDPDGDLVRYLTARGGAAPKARSPHPGVAGRARCVSRCRERDPRLAAAVADHRGAGRAPQQDPDRAPLVVTALDRLHPVAFPATEP